MWWRYWEQQELVAGGASAIPAPVNVSRPLLPNQQSEMETLPKYGGGGGINHTAFMRNARIIYNRLKLDPNNHRMEGFGVWEFVEMLGVALTGEAREVHNAFLKSWDSRKHVAIALLKNAGCLDFEKSTYLLCRQSCNAHAHLVASHG